MIKLPLNGNWTQTNISDRVDSLAWTKNINLDKKGYLKLSPRTINIFDDSASTTNVADTDFDYPVAFGRYGDGDFRLATTDEPFNIDISPTTKTIAEDAGSNNPNLNSQSHGVWWQNRFHESTDTAVNYNASGTWTANAITSLTSGVRHYMAVFASRTQLCVSNGNVVKQYNTSYSNTTDLTIPSDYEITGLAYNNSQMAVITRIGSDSAGQNVESRFFVWGGSGTSADSDAGVGAYATVAVRPYKTSFVILTSAGQLLYWNGGGFDELASFPIYFEGVRWGNLTSHFAYGDNMVVDGDTILMNLGFDIDGTSRKGENYMVNNPSGVWCYDPQVGLYHKYSSSNSKAYLHTITSANINTTTNVFTTSSTIPATGNLAMMPTKTITGLNLSQPYYIIKLSSTTFQLAETKDEAESGVAVDITAVSDTNYLWLYDIIDYGASHNTSSGAITLFDTNTSVYRDVIFGSNVWDTSASGTVKVLNICVPFIEARGYAVTPKLFLNNSRENIQSLTIKHSPLNTEDKIIVKVKDKSIFGLPTTTPDTTGNVLTWTSAFSGYTEMDLSEAKSAIEANEELELEIVAGIGAGQLIKITDIDESNGTYVVTVAEPVVGYSSGLKSYFAIDNWRYCSEVSSTTQNEGVFDCPIAVAGKSVQFKIELRGYETTIEDIFINDIAQEK